MRIGGAGTVLLPLLILSVETAAGGVDLGLEFSTQKMMGYTKYHIEFTEFYPEIGGDVKGDSELEFPLDVFLVGGALRLEGRLKSGEPWGMELGASKNLNHPRGYMKDSDWIAVPQYHFASKFSYTESDAELDALLVHVEARLGIVRSTNLAVDIVGDMNTRTSPSRSWAYGGGRALTCRTGFTSIPCRV